MQELRGSVISDISLISQESRAYEKAPILYIDRKVNSMSRFDEIFMKIFAKDRNKLTNEDIKEILQDAKLDWLKDKAAKLGIYLTEEMLKNDPARLKRWLRKKAQQKGIDFDSNFESIGYQLKKMVEHMRIMGMINSKGEVIIAKGIRGAGVRNTKADTTRLMADIQQEFLRIANIDDMRAISLILTGRRDDLNKLTRSNPDFNNPNEMLEFMYKIHKRKWVKSLGISPEIFTNLKEESLKICCDFLFEPGYVFDGGSRDLFEFFSDIVFLLSDAKGKFIDFTNINKELIKDSISAEYNIAEMIKNDKTLLKEELMDLRRNILNHKFTHPELVKNINTKISEKILEHLRDLDVEFINFFGEEGTRAMIVAGTDQDQLDNAFNKILKKSSSLRMEIDSNNIFSKKKQKIQEIFSAYRDQNDIRSGEQPLSLIYFEGEKGGTYYKALFFVRKIDQPLSGLRITHSGQIELVKDDFYSRRYAGVRIGRHQGSNKYLLSSLLGLEIYEKYSVQKLIEEKIQAQCTERMAMINFDLFLLNNQFDSGKVVLASEWWFCDVCKYNYRLFEDNCIRNNIIPMFVDGTNK